MPPPPPETCREAAHAAYPHAWSSYVELSVEGGRRTLSISPNHRLPVRAALAAVSPPFLADPSDVRVGQYVAVAASVAEAEEWVVVTRYFVG
jgi:hypothetical protein